MGAAPSPCRAALGAPESPEQSAEHVAVGDLGPAIDIQDAKRGTNAVRKIASDTNAFDPRDHDWCPPSDEDRPWESAPHIALGSPIKDKSGVVLLVPKRIHEEMAWPPVQQLQDLAAIGDCKICLQAMTAEDAVTFKCGTHAFHAKCAAEYIHHELQELHVPRCPMPDCQSEACARLVLRSVDKKEFDKYLLAALLQSGCVMTCPGCSQELYVPELGDMQVVQARLAGTQAEKRRRRRRGAKKVKCFKRKSVRFLEDSAIAVQRHQADDSAAGVAQRPSSVWCPECCHRICMLCELVLHPGLSCAAARRRAERRRQKEASRRFMSIFYKEGLKKCPKCDIPCQKGEEHECDHITCVCGHHFCWECLADRRVIYAHGNHYHEMSCKHYAHYEETPTIAKSCPVCQTTKRACIPPYMLGSHITDTMINPTMSSSHSAAKSLQSLSTTGTSSPSGSEGYIVAMESTGEVGGEIDSADSTIDI